MLHLFRYFLLSFYYFTCYQLAHSNGTIKESLISEQLKGQGYGGILCSTLGLAMVNASPL